MYGVYSSWSGIALHVVSIQAQSGTCVSSPRTAGTGIICGVSPAPCMMHTACGSTLDAERQHWELDDGTLGVGSGPLARSSVRGEFSMFIDI